MEDLQKVRLNLIQKMVLRIMQAVINLEKRCLSLIFLRKQSDRNLRFVLQSNKFYDDYSFNHHYLYIHTYIISRPFPFGVGRDHFLPLATILTNIFRFFHCHQIPHTRSPVSGTPDLALIFDISYIDTSN
jgi:hypothetical protein